MILFYNLGFYRITSPQTRTFRDKSSENKENNAKKN